MNSLFSEDYDDHFYASKDSEPKKEDKPAEETPEEREERELKELTYDRSSKKKKIIITFAVVALVIGVFTAIWLRYFHPYIVSEETGVILKVKSEGTFIKTYEVQMISEKFITDTTRTFKADFEFTVRNDSLAAKISQYQSTGRRVTVKYEEFKGMLPWRGETNRIATAMVVDGVTFTGLPAAAAKETQPETKAQ